jgi:hypothetical protein
MRDWYQELRPVVDRGLWQPPAARLGDGLQLFDAGIDFAGNSSRRLPPPLGKFSGWGPSIPLATVVAARGGPLNDDVHRLYRLSRRGQRRPLYIGMTKIGIARRLRAHLRGAGSARLRRVLQDLVAQHGMPWVMNNVKVRTAHIVGMGQRVDMNLLHQYELNLQRTERPVAWDPNDWSFDDFEDVEEMP